MDPVTAYTVPADIVYETSDSSGKPVVVTYPKGEVVPADAAEEVLLASLEKAGLVSPAPKTKTTKSAPVEPKE